MGKKFTLNRAGFSFDFEVLEKLERGLSKKGISIEEFSRRVHERATDHLIKRGFKHEDLPDQQKSHEQLVRLLKDLFGSEARIIHERSRYPKEIPFKYVLTTLEEEWMIGPYKGKTRKEKRRPKDRCF